MSIFLQRSGIISEVAENGLVGLRMYMGKPTEYDIIFLDLQMPVMDGYEMARQIRASGTPTSSTIPIVAMSGAYTGDMAKKYGIDYFLNKPFEIRRITEIIQELIKKSYPECTSF